MSRVYEIGALFITASLLTGLIVRLPDTTKFVHATLTDFNSLAKTISGQRGTGAVSTAA